jgi:hypothetical protein
VESQLHVTYKGVHTVNSMAENINQTIIKGRSG